MAFEALMMQYPCCIIIGKTCGRRVLGLKTHKIHKWVPQGRDICGVHDLYCL